MAVGQQVSSRRGRWPRLAARVLLWTWLGVLAAHIMLPGAGAGANAAPSLREPILGFHLGQGDAEGFAAAEAAGGRFAVVVFSWRDIQPTPEHFYWETPDAVLRAAAYYRLEVVARLDRPPDWARVANGPTPWDLDAYANFVRLAAQRYGTRLAGAIIWNEPNLALEWDGRTPDPRGYAALLAAAHGAVKAVAPDLPVLAAGLAFTNGDGAKAFNDLAYLEQLYAAGASAHFDVLAAHPYGFGRPPADPPAADRLNFRRLELHREIMAARGDSAKPVWITEMGWRTSAPPADRWQVVTPAVQRTYTLAARAWAAQYAWLPRLAFWELNPGEDLYGYALWQGPGRSTPAYTALVAQSAVDRTAPSPAQTTGQPPAALPVEILAPDVSIRLGDRGELHPHWVHLHRGGRLFSPDWRGEFFLSGSPEDLAVDLLLETMQVDQPTNRIAINDYPLAPLRPRTRLDPTSTWVTQRLAVPRGVLRPGRNEITITSGQRLPARQYGWWRWENFQFRNIRLADRFVFPPPTIRWDAANEGRGPASLSGWAETNRVRAMAEGPALWLTANRGGQIWLLDPRTAAPRLQPQAGEAAGEVFLDVAAAGAGADAQAVAATANGLLWRVGAAPWRPTAGAPDAYAYVVIHHAGMWYAGFATQGVWTAAQPAGPWLPLGLAGRTVLDLAAAGEVLYAGTDGGVHALQDGAWTRLPGLPPPGASAETGDQVHANFVPRLWASAAGELVVRSEDRLFAWTPPAAGRAPAAPAAGSWQPYGPEELQGSLLAAAGCCASGALVGANGQGLWELGAGGAWRRIDGGYFSGLEINDIARTGGSIFVAAANGLFVGDGDSAAEGWRKVEGLPATMTDLLVDPQNARLWTAATPAGVYRTPDAGRTWQAISPPWGAWDLAWGADGALWVARGAGVARTVAADTATGDGAGAARPPGVAWQPGGSMDGVLFFTVSPDPADPAALWAGSWGNDIGVTTDGGLTLQSLHNGLETLSVLSILRHPTPGQYTIGTIAGLFRSDDGGASWFKLPGPLADQTVYALHQGTDGVIWAGSANGLWSSADYGATWAPAPGVPPRTVIRLGELTGALTGEGASELTGNGPPRLWAGTEDSGLWLSADAGATWQFGGLDGRSIYALIAVPADSPGEGARLVAATDAGLRTGR